MKALKLGSIALTTTLLVTGFNMPEAKAQSNRTEMSGSFVLAADDHYTKKTKVVQTTVITPLGSVRTTKIKTRRRLIRKTNVVAPGRVIYRW